MTIMVIVAIVLLVLHWGGRNAVWGGATLGVIVGFIISLITEDWNPLAISFVVGTFAGTIFEWVGKSAVALKHKKGTTFDNLEYNYSFSCSYFICLWYRTYKRFCDYY